MGFPEMFKFHKLNQVGVEKAKKIQEAYESLLRSLADIGCLGGREGAIAMTKMEESCFFAKKAMAIQEENQE